MAKAAKNTAEKPPQPPPEPPHQEDSDPLSALLESLSTDADDIRASVFDLSGDAPEWIANYRAEEVTTERIAADLGGGIYRVQLRDAKGIYRGQVTIRISRRFPRPATLGAAPAAAIAAPIAPPPNDPLREVLTAMIASQGQIIAAIASRPEPAHPPPPAPLSDAIMLEMLRRNSPAKESRSAELREMIELISEMRGEPRDDREPDLLPSGAMDLLGKMLTASSGGSPGTGSPPLAPPAGPGRAPGDTAATKLAGRLSAILEMTTPENSQAMIERAARDIIASGLPIESIAGHLADDLSKLPPDRAATAIELAQCVVDRVEAIQKAPTTPNAKANA
jgi:hypothetical protein